jgi:hypothetical protein
VNVAAILVIAIAATGELMMLRIEPHEPRRVERRNRGAATALAGAGVRRATERKILIVFRGFGFHQKVVSFCDVFAT